MAKPGELISKATESISKATHYVQTDIWRVRLQDLKGREHLLVRYLRVLLLALKGFREDNIPLRASALTFFSLLSVVPLMAMAFGVAKGFGLEALLEKELTDQFAGQEEILVQILSFSKSMLENTKGGLIAGFGMVFLLYTVMKLLNNIEVAFNGIWGITQHRPYIRRFTDYLAILIIAPLLSIISSSLTIFIATYISDLTQEVELLGFLRPLVFFLIKLTPFIAIWLLFTLVYIIMPNTKVNFKSALVGGILAGTTYVLIQYVYINFQVGVSRQNAIYGSFAALPLFLIWMQLSWLITLIGAKISFAYQNVEMFEFEKDSIEMSQAFKRRITLIVAHLLVKNFTEGKKSMTVSDLSHELQIPFRMIYRVTRELVDCNIISETAIEGSKDPGFQPAQDTNHLSVQFVLQTLEDKGFNSIELDHIKDSDKINATLDSFKSILSETSANKLLKDL